MRNLKNGKIFHCYLNTFWYAIEIIGISVITRVCRRYLYNNNNVTIYSRKGYITLNIIQIDILITYCMYIVYRVIYSNKTDKPVKVHTHHLWPIYVHCLREVTLLLWCLVGRSYHGWTHWIWIMKPNIRGSECYWSTLQYMHSLSSI